MKKIAGSIAVVLLTVAACGGSEWKPVAAPSVFPVAPGPKTATPPSAPPPSAAPSGPQASAVDGSLPPPADVPVLEARAACKAGTCKLKELVPAAARPAKDSKAPSAVWEHVIAKNAVVEVPRDSDVELYGVVLRGQVTLGTQGRPEHLAPLGPWHAFRAPGAGLDVRAKDAEARVAFIVSTGGAPLAEAIARFEAKPEAVSWTKRTEHVARIDFGAQPDLAWNGGSAHARIGFEGPASRSSLSVLLMSKDAAVAEHVHDKEWEMLALLNATDGDFTTKGADGKSVTSKTQDGAVLTVAPGTAHAFKPAGTEITLAIQAYTPPGPEQRFKKLASP